MRVEELQADLTRLKLKMSVIEKRIEKCNTPENCKHFKSIRETYSVAIRSVERTLEIIKDLDKDLLNTVSSRQTKIQKSYKVQKTSSLS